MRFIHSNKQYIERTMYPINPYMNAPEVPLTMEAFVAPANFDPDAQELNIVKAFAAYNDSNKKYIFSVGTSATTVLPAATGRSYAYSENGGAYTTIVSGTVTWTGGSTKRHVVVMDTAALLTASIPVGGVWGFVGDKVNGVISNNSYLKYIHCQNVLSITKIDDNAFNGCTNLTGNLTIPNGVQTIGYAAFEGCKFTGTFTIGSAVTYITYYPWKFPISSTVDFSNIVSLSPNYVVEDKVLYQVVSPTNYLALFSCRNYVGTLTLNPNVVTIASSCFVNSKRTGGLVLPNGLKYIDRYVFNNAAFTGALSIPNSVLTLGADAFKSTKFTSLSFGTGLTSISDNCFANITGLTGNLTLPESLISLGIGVFDGTNMSGTLTIGSNLTSVYWTSTSSAFSSNLMFTNIVSTSAKYPVYDNVLYQVDSPTAYTALFAAKNYPQPLTLHPNTVVVAPGCFVNSKRTGNLILPNLLTTLHKVSFSTCKDFTGDLVIPNGVTTLGNECFSSCSGLTGALTIPSGMTNVGYYSFNYCSFSRVNMYPLSAPTASSSFFQACGTLHIKAGATGYNVAPWTNTAIFSSIIADL